MDIFESWLVNKYICKGGIVTPQTPENTLASYELAVKKDYAIMMSVQMISDETIICFNDISLARLTKQNGYTFKLMESDLKDLHIGGTEYTIPTLEQALETVNGRVPVLLNIINDNGLAKACANITKILNEYKGEVAIMSTNPMTVEWFRDNAPSIFRGIKACKFKTKKLGSLKTSKLKKLKYNKICDPNFICYTAENLPNRFVKRYKTLPLIAFNVNSHDEYMDVAQHSDNIIFSGFTPKI